MQHTSLGPLAGRPHRSPRSACATGYASSTSRSRWPGVTQPECRRTPAAAMAAVLRRHLPDGRSDASPTPTGWRRPPLGEQRLRGYLSGSIDVVLRVGDGRPALPGRRLQDQPAGRARRAADRARLHPGADDRGDAALATTRCRRCSTRWCCTATCAGGCPATTPSGTSAASSTSTSAACAGRRPREVDGHPCGVFSLAPAGRHGGRALRPARRHLGAASTRPGGGVVTATLTTWDPRATAGVPSAPPACCGSSTRPRCCTRPTSTSRPGSGSILREESDEQVLLAAALAVRAVRHGVDLPRPRATDLRGPAAGGRRDSTRRTQLTTALAGAGRVARPRWPPARWCARRCCGSRAPTSTSTATGARRARSATTWSTRIRRTPPEVDEPALDAGLDRVFPESGFDEQRERGPRRRPRSGRRAHRRPGHRQDHHGRRPACPGRRAARARAPVATPDRPVPHPPARPRPGCRRPSSEAASRQAARGPGRPGSGSPGCSASTLHRLLGWRPDSSVRFRHHRSQPAAARRGRGRRDLDGLADDDGAAAGGGPTRRPAGAGRRPRPAASVEAGAVLADLVAGLREVGRLPGGRADHHPPLSASTSARWPQALRDGEADA